MQERLGPLFEIYRNRHDLHKHGKVYHAYSALTMTFFAVALANDLIQVMNIPPLLMNVPPPE
jgi:hypothetical protein